MSVPKLTLSFTQPVRYWPYCFAMAIGLAIAGTWLLLQPREAAIIARPSTAQGPITLPPKVSGAQQELLLGMQQHPWRLLAALDATQVAGVRVVAMEWQGANRPLLLTAEVGQEGVLQRWQQKLAQHFAGVALRSAVPTGVNQAMNVQLEMRWPR